MSSPYKTVSFHTLGCKLNYAESSTLSRELIENGFIKVDYSEPSDVAVINTCSVTNNANKKCRKIIRQIINRAPNTFVAIIGCYAQLKPDEITSIPGVDLVLGANEKFKLPKYLRSLKINGTARSHTTDINSIDSFSPSWSYRERTRSFLKIQDGCDYNCTFCTIPMARGKSRNIGIQDSVQIVEKIAKKGVQEVVLTGVNIGDFGKSTGESFIDLIIALDKIKDIQRFRISSIEPNLLTNEIIEFVSQSKKFLPHFHIPIQSGSNKMLKLMKRRYLREVVVDRVEKIRKLLPEACIASDVIVGCRSETKKEFEETVDFIKSLDISYLHVFSYSERDGTEAIKMSQNVPIEERMKRSQIIRELSNEKKYQFYENNINSTDEVLFETFEDGMLFGFTRNYVRVMTEGSSNLCNHILAIRMLENQRFHVKGEIVN